MSRRKFIESVGASCRNWRSSWAFVDKARHIVIFGAWDTGTQGSTSLILDRAWERGASGRKNAAFAEALEYVGLVEQEGYGLQTFPMVYTELAVDEHGRSSGLIGAFRPELSDKVLHHVAGKWYASSESLDAPLPEEVTEPTKYVEGSAKSISVNAYERNAAARAACIQHYGFSCFTCGFNFEVAYGTIGRGLIHVHHLRSLAQIGKEYEVNPISDLRPVCPNCHAIIHRTQPPLEMEQLKEHLTRSREAHNPSIERTA